MQCKRVKLFRKSKKKQRGGNQRALQVSPADNELLFHAVEAAAAATDVRNCLEMFRNTDTKKKKTKRGTVRRQDSNFELSKLISSALTYLMALPILVISLSASIRAI